MRRPAKATDERLDANRIINPVQVNAGKMADTARRKREFGHPIEKPTPAATEPAPEAPLPDHGTTEG